MSDEDELMICPFLNRVCFIQHPRYCGEETIQKCKEKYGVNESNSDKQHISDVSKKSFISKISEKIELLVLEYQLRKTSRIIKRS